MVDSKDIIEGFACVVAGLVTEPLLEALLDALGYVSSLPFSMFVPLLVGIDIAIAIREAYKGGALYALGVMITAVFLRDFITLGIGFLSLMVWSLKWAKKKSEE